jgi:hypothetical protein
MAPITLASAQSARERLDLLNELCQSNCFVSINEVFENEIHWSLNPLMPKPSMVAHDGQWFPLSVSEEAPSKIIMLRDELKAYISDKGSNRKEKRKMNQKAMKAGEPRKHIKNNALKILRTKLANNYMQKYPMKPADLDVLLRFACGEARQNQVDAVFDKNLRDTSWILTWLSTSESVMSPLSKVFRSPARDLIAKVDEVAQSYNLTNTPSNTGLSNEKQLQNWTLWCESTISNFKGRLAKDMHLLDFILIMPSFNLGSTPGLDNAIGALFKAWYPLGGNRQRKESDVSDAFHSVYLPYVDIFRCDRFMAPHMRKLSSNTKVEIVSELKELPNVIKTHLRERT